MKSWPIFKGVLAEMYDYTQTGFPPKSFFAKILRMTYFRNAIPQAPRVDHCHFTLNRTSFPKIGDNFVNIFLSANYQNGAAQDGQKLERTFAASAVQYRSPFLDRELVSLVFNIPEKLKFKRGRNKYILRKSLENIVPHEFLSVPKKPQRMDYDLQFADTIDDLCSQILNPKAIHRRGFFREEDIQRLLRNDRKTVYSPEACMRLWTAICTEIWARLFIDNRYEDFIDS